METYTGENKNNMQDGENLKATDSAEDLFLPGGFDSFGGTPEPMNADMGQMNSNMGQLGNVDYGNDYGSADYSTNRWANPIIVLKFEEQISNSFKPTQYSRYKGMSEEAAKGFVKSFARLYINIVFVIMALVMLLSGMGSGAGILIMAVFLGIAYFLSIFLEPYSFRLRAFIYRVIFGTLITAVTKANISSTNLYIVSIYACVPCMVISTLMTCIIALAYALFPLLLYPLATVSSIVSIVQLFIPVIIMAIAIPRME